MAENIIGPFGPGVNETTTRPADQSPGSAIDTWFAPCINGDPSTGTRVTATWLNKVTALLRRAIRGMNVPDDALDDDMLLKAIQKADVPLRSVGAGIAIFDGKADGYYNIRSLVAGENISIIEADAPDGAGKRLVLSATGGAAGEPTPEPIVVLKGDGSPTPAILNTGDILKSLVEDFASSPGGPSWNASTGEITVPTDGIWRISGTLHADDYQASSDTNIAELAIYVNGVRKLRFAPHFCGWGQSEVTFAFDGVVQCAAGDVITLRAWQDSFRHFREADYSQVVVQRIRGPV